MSKRLFLLLGIVLFVGIVTRAFGQGTPSGQSPMITRAGAVALLVESQPQWQPRVEYVARHMPPMPLFDDVDQTQWYAPYVEVAFEKGLITGNPDRTFRPNELMNSGEAVVMLERFKDQGADTWTHDEADESSFLMSVASAAQIGIQLPNGFDATRPVQRTDLFSMMNSAGIMDPGSVRVPSSLLAIAYPQLVAQVDDANPLQPIETMPSQTQTSTSTSHTTTAKAPSTPSAPADPTQPSSKSFAITMPSIGITDLTVTHPADATTAKGLLVPLQSGVGHLFGYPGGGGKILIYGHSSSYPWDVSKYTKIFRQINKLSVGDKIYITYNAKVYIYQVTYKQTVDANDMSAYQGGGSEELILYTCWPPDSIKQRYLVHATPVAS